MKYASIDIGLKRIGVAVSADGRVIIPQSAIFRKNRNQASNKVSEFLKENNIEVLVVGLPKGGKDEEEMERRIKHFVSLIEFDGKIEYVDEYGSSLEAKEISKGIFRHKKDGKIDSIAAKIILERFLYSIQALLFSWQLQF